MATFEEWDKFEPITSNLSASSLRQRGWNAGAASRDAEVAELKSMLLTRQKQCEELVEKLEPREHRCRY